jgi:hypothetical protein
MNYNRHILFFLFLLLSQSSFSQFYPDSIYVNRIEAKRNILKTNPFTIVQGPIPYVSEFRLAYEHVTSERTSIQISGSYLAKGFMLLISEAATSPPINLKVLGYRFQAEFRYYLIKRKKEICAPTGIYIAPLFSYSNARISNKSNVLQDEYYNITYTNYCLKFGIQIIKNNLAFDPFVGLGYRDNIWQEHFNNATNVMNKKDIPFYSNNPLKILLGFNAGWAF